MPFIKGFFGGKNAIKYKYFEILYNGKLQMKTQKICISGLVQGVGFRPFVYNLARKLQVNGYVKNTNSNISILIQAKDSQKIADFVAILKAKPPQNAIISRISIRNVEKSKVFSNFCILASKTNQKKQKSANLKDFYSAIPRDLALCKDCQKELQNPQDRRFNYAFINCINCGPRWTIIQNLPYDRERTAMSGFKMCKSCAQEYSDTKNRRFHAQPNSCSDCGIKLAVFDKNGTMTLRESSVDFTNQSAIFAFVREKIKQGKIICFKGIGGFNLICAVRERTIAELRARKSRVRKPFAIMFSDIKSAKKYFHISKVEETALLSPSAPIVLLNRPKVALPQNLSCHLNTYGVIIAYSALHKLLFKDCDKPLIFTSANLSGESIIIDKSVAQAKIAHIYDYLLDYNRAIINPIDDSLKRILRNGVVMNLRAGRGDYPFLRQMKFKSNEVILALGAHQKCQIALFFNGYMLISRYIGDLDNISVIESYRHEIEFLLNLYDVRPSVILCDCHSGYESSKIAKSLAQKWGGQDFSVKIARIYHHRAHFYSCLFDNNLAHKNDENILGVVFDGTGLGEDGTIWGGEFFWLGNSFSGSHSADFGIFGVSQTPSLVSRPKFAKNYESTTAIPSVVDSANLESKNLSFRESKANEMGEIRCANAHKLYRIAHFSHFALLGGESAIKDIRKIALGVLFSVYGRAIPLESQFQNVALFYQMFQKNLNTPKTSSVGRIFDFVAFMCGLESQSFEGESGGYIESLYTPKIRAHYDFEIKNGEICIDKIIRGIVRDYGNPALIATKFINTLAQIILQIALDLRQNAPNLKVIFSGGVFANKILCDKISRKFQAHKILHYFNREIPTNDGGIAVGQIVAFLRGDYER